MGRRVVTPIVSGLLHSREDDRFLSRNDRGYVLVYVEQPTGRAEHTIFGRTTPHPMACSEAGQS